MSLQEIIEIAIALPNEDKIRLVKAIQDDCYAKRERELADMLTPGFVGQVWLPQVTEWPSMELMLEEIEKVKRTIK